ncbi:FBD-like protein [Artemisia annua]|uniref:FBD-like protein n=1 Tax=Artemisia annua TaxID=35608 RepID=A0A2U1KB48_ARTAN|nr:FBD-like protein [Artemisia annua]
MVYDFAAAFESGKALVSFRCRHKLSALLTILIILSGEMIGLLLQPLTALLLLIQNPITGGSSLSEMPMNLRYYCKLRKLSYSTIMIRGHPVAPLPGWTLNTDVVQDKPKKPDAIVIGTVLHTCSRAGGVCPRDMSSTGEEVDRLPKELLSNVLSLMPTKFAVRTSILSKRWRNNWKLVHNLDFDFSVIHHGFSFYYLLQFVVRILKHSLISHCPSSVNLPNLKTLDVVLDSKTSDNAFKFINGCPVLEHLSLARVSCEVDDDHLLVELLKGISEVKSLSLAINYTLNDASSYSNCVQYHNLLRYSCDSPLPKFPNLKHLELKRVITVLMNGS